ncbi:MAG: hypothetical protein HY964_10210 [Ignavibacteriales bacterium]|nr:hypothetical protein [Ignavibacteriales bacterium]
MNWYINIVSEYPIISAMIQFAFLGTLGDMISKWIVVRKIYFPFAFRVLLLKMLEWSALAVCIKYAFIGFQGFVDSLVLHNLLPELNLFTRSLSISISMNLQFGPFLVIMHRILDNAIAKEKNWNNLDKGLLSLLWFWIPAHTITFILPRPFQIGLAAIWSVMLGIILGYYNRPKSST